MDVLTIAPWGYTVAGCWLLLVAVVLAGLAQASSGHPAPPQRPLDPEDDRPPVTVDHAPHLIEDLVAMVESRGGAA